MRTTFVLIGSVALLLGACSSKNGGSHAPPPLDKSLLIGKWKNVSEAQFLSGYDFDADGNMKITLAGMKDPLSAKYAWSGERTLDLEYPKSADVQKVYEDAAKAYKNNIKDRIAKKELDGRAGPSMLGAVADKLPPKETFMVGIADPRYLVLTRDGGNMQNFERTK